MLHYLDPAFLVSTFGLLGVFGIIFAETGLFFGFFFPGDSLLFTAGLLASQGHFSFALLWAGSVLCAVAGDTVGYSFGVRAGEKLFDRDDSLLFKKEYLRRTEQFYAKHGKKTLVLARFVPVVRTFAPILAGVARMPYAVFFSYNVVGGILWASLMVNLGFALGSIIPGIDRYLLPIIMLIILISFLPALPELVGFTAGKKRDAALHAGEDGV